MHRLQTVFAFRSFPRQALPLFWKSGGSKERSFRGCAENSYESTGFDDVAESASEDEAARLGENGKMFGAITSKEIADTLSQEGFEIDKKQIILNSNIKSTGRYTIEVKLYSGVIGKFDIVVE